MNIIAVANAAGSAGKTTTVVTLAALLAEAGQRVVVVDLDGQANATRWLGVDPRTLAHTVGDGRVQRRRGVGRDEHAGGAPIARELQCER